MNGLIARVHALPYKSTFFYTNFVCAVARAISPFMLGPCRCGIKRELVGCSRVAARDFKTKAPVMKGAPALVSKERKAGNEQKNG